MTNALHIGARVRVTDATLPEYRTKFAGRTGTLDHVKTDPASVFDSGIMCLVVLDGGEVVALEPHEFEIIGTTNTHRGRAGAAQAAPSAAPYRPAQGAATYSAGESSSRERAARRRKRNEAPAATNDEGS